MTDTRRSLRQTRIARRRATIVMWTVLAVLAAYVFLTVMWLHG